MVTTRTDAANSPGAHTRTNPATGGKSAPDLTVCHSNLLGQVAKSWRCEKDMGSDHLPVTFALAPDIPRAKRGKAKWCFRKADWEKFRETLEELETSTPQADHTSSLEDDNRRFTEMVLKAAHSAIPGGARGGPNKPFWNERCAEAREKCVTARRRAEDTKTEDDIHEYNVARRETTKTIHQEKKECLMEKASALKVDSDLFGLLRSFNGEGPKSKDSAAIERPSEGSPLIPDIQLQRISRRPTFSARCTLKCPGSSG
jgi:hypothetical protein